MKKFCLSLAVASLFLVLSSRVQAISLDDIQLWTGSGTNRAALVIEWNSPVVFNSTTVPAPVTEKTLVWGYRFNGTVSGTQLFDAVVAADHHLYAIQSIFTGFGPYVDAIGYNLNSDGLFGVTDGSNTYHSRDFTNGLLIGPNLEIDAAAPLNAKDLFWSGSFGPNWQSWTEQGDNGGFTNSPNRGASPFYDPNTFNHGEWSFAEDGLDGLIITNGSWLGYSVAAAGYTSDTNEVAAMTAYNLDEQAPPSPDGTYTAYVSNTNDFAVQVISSNLVDTAAPYNNPAALLGRPTLKFVDHFGIGSQFNAIDRTKLIEAPYWKDPQSNAVITEISLGGEITLDLGRKVYDDPNNPYGVDFIVYAYSFFSAEGATSAVSDHTDQNVVTLSSGIFGHATTVSVSQDGTNWYAFSQVPVVFPQNAYRWDATNGSWTDEEANPTKPLNPIISGTDFAGQTVASALNQFVGATGGTGYDLKSSGLPWIQYVRIQTSTNDYTVIDAVAAVNPVVVGDDLSLAPANLAAGITNLVFQNPADTTQTLISLNFNSVSDVAKISTVSLSDFSAYNTIIGAATGGYQITLRSLTDAAITANADLGLRAASNYSGNGNDLRVYAGIGTNLTRQSFTFNSTNKEVLLSGVTNFSAFVISQIVPPKIQAQTSTGGLGFQFTPVPNCVTTLERSTDFVTWTPVVTMTPTNSQTVTLQDSAPPQGKAFYRLHVNVP